MKMGVHEKQTQVDWASRRGVVKGLEVPVVQILMVKAPLHLPEASWMRAYLRLGLAWRRGHPSA